MSADNWAICPQCKAKAEVERQALLDKLEAGYGVIPKDEYLTLTKQTEDAPKLQATLREDWGIGMSETGELDIDYSCSCRVCGFCYDFKRSEQALIRKQGASK